MARFLKNSNNIQVMSSQLADYYLKSNKTNEAKRLLDQLLLDTHNNVSTR